MKQIGSLFDVHLSLLLSRPLALVLCLSCLCFVGTSHAEWAEIDKDEDVTHLWDKEAVKSVHVSRYVWTLSDYAKAGKTYKGDTFSLRWCVGACIAKMTPLSDCLPVTLINL